MSIFQKGWLKWVTNLLQARTRWPRGHRTEFMRWCKKATRTLADAHQYDLQVYVNNNIGDLATGLAALLKDVRVAIQSNKAFNLALNQAINNQEISIVGRSKNELATDIARLQVIGIGMSSLRLEGLAIELLQIYHAVSILDLVNCQIGKIEIGGGGDSLRLTSKNTSVGLLHLTPACIHYLDVTGGCILNFNCPTPSSGNPFMGHVAFAPSVFLPKDTKNYLLESAQPYRNIRHHLRALHNSEAASLFHSAELIVERERASWTDNLVSRLYGSFSDFGNSILRPFLWWLLLIAATTFAALHIEGGLISTDATTKNVGWPTNDGLYADNDLGLLFRAVYAAFTAAINPFGLFGSKSLLIAQNSWLAAVLTAEQILSAVLITLIIFAIRRRFKIQQE